jgi:hypothetical protein
MLDEPRGNVYGGIVSAPVFSEVGGWVLNYLQINPRFRTAKAVEPPILISKDSDVIKKVEAVSRKLFEDESLLPDFRGKSLREVLSGGRSLGLKVIPEGTGLAVRQSPRPGAPLKGITTLNVLFKAPI